MKCKNCKNLIDHWCEKVIDSPDEEMDRECKHYEVMSNADRIKNMSVEELAQTLFNHQFGHCSECALKNKECSGNYFDDLSCIFGIKKWLLSEAKDNG